MRQWKSEKTIRPSPVSRGGVASLPRAAAVLASLLLFGCDAQRESMTGLRMQIDAQKKQIVDLEKRIVTLEEERDAQARQIATLQRIAPDRMAKLVTVDRIVLDRLTGGYDEDGRPGDEGVVAYIQPLDADGHVIKAAGSIRMEVFDLANPPERSLVCRGDWDVDHTRKAWSGRLWTNHFTVRCPWPPPDRRPPAHRELTVRVEFTELLTGRKFTAQTACTIKFAADLPATRPALKP